MGNQPGDIKYKGGYNRRLVWTRQDPPSSLSSIYMTRERNNKPTLILCPVGVLQNWINTVRMVLGPLLGLKVFYGSSVHTGDQIR